MPYLIHLFFIFFIEDPWKRRIAIKAVVTATLTMVPTQPKLRKSIISFTAAKPRVNINTGEVAAPTNLVMSGFGILALCWAAFNLVHRCFVPLTDFFELGRYLEKRKE